MPGILQHPPTEVILEIRPHQPIPVPHIILPRPLPHRLPPHGKLRAAIHTDLVRHLLPGKQLLKGLLVDSLGRHGLVQPRRPRILYGPDLRGAAEDPYASEVDVAGLAEVFEAKVLEEWEGVVVWVVVVPLESLGVMEDDVARQDVVVIDQVSVQLETLKLASHNISLHTEGKKSGIGEVTYVRNTMASLPLLTGTVKGAYGSSTT